MIQNLSLIPKVELHLHLDCSLSFEAVNKLAPEVSKSEYKKNFVAPAKCTDLADFLSCTQSGIELMQTEKQIKIAVEDIFRQLRNDNIIYAEIRFAPLQHLSKGYQANEIVNIAASAVIEQSDLTGIKANLILCTLRHYNKKQSFETVKLVDEFEGAVVAGFDIAADEAGYPIDQHIKAFEYAYEKGIPVTAHAGEAKGPESVWETLHFFKTKRIGHGVRSIEDGDLIKVLIDRDIHLEVCPTCNIQTDIYKTFSEHPVNKLFESGISVGINTDARALVNVSLNEEYRKLSETFGWNIDHFLKVNLNAISASFLTETEKLELSKRIVENYDIIK